MTDDDLGPLPTEHPRSLACRTARIEFEDVFSELRNKYKLTTCEALQILSGEIADMLGYALGAERRRTDTAGPGGKTDG